MEIQRVAVIGAGIMGAQIGQVMATSGLDIRLEDVSAEQLRSALQRIEHSRFGLRAGVDRGKLTREEADQALRRLETTTDIEAACDGVDMVIEAVPEDPGLKAQVFRQLDRAAPPDAILTTNSAGLSIAAIACVTDRPERVLGWHWFQPCAVMRLAELVVHDVTDPEVVATIARTAERCGKRPQVVRDFPYAWGFVGNRINAAVRREAAQIVADGIATEDQIDAIMRDGFRWPMGPFENQRQDSLE